MSTIAELTVEIERLARDRVHDLRAARCKGHLERAAVYAEQGQWDHAVSDYSAYMELKTGLEWGTDPFTRQCFAWALLESGRFMEAADAFDALGLDEESVHLADSWRARAAFARVLHALEEYRQHRIDGRSLKQTATTMGTQAMWDPDRFANQRYPNESPDRVLELDGPTWRAVHRRNAQDVAARVLAIIHDEYSDLSSYADTLDMIRADPKRAFELASAWDQGEECYGRARFLAAIAAYEMGDLDVAKAMVRDYVAECKRHSGSVLAFALGEKRQQDPMSIMIFSLATDHPAVHLAWVYRYCWDKRPIEALVGIAHHFALPGALHPFAAHAIEEVLKTPMVYDQSTLYQDEWMRLAALAQQLGHLTHACEWYVESAHAPMRTAEGSLGASPLYLTAPREEWRDNEAAPQAYLQAAECCEVIGDADRAAAYYRKAGDPDRAAAAPERIRQLHKQADVKLTLQAPDRLTLLEWDILTVSLENTGYGPATNVEVHVAGPLTLESVPAVARIGVGETSGLEIAFRPDNAGRAVPITLTVSYDDPRGHHELPPLSHRLRVFRPDELHSGLGEPGGRAANGGQLS